MLAARFAGVLLLAMPAAAQTVHFVGVGGNIGSAIAAAAPGDVIEVQAGTYGYLTVPIGVTIRGMGPGPVVVPGATVNCPAPQAAYLIGFEVETLYVNGATCSLEDCTLHQGSASGGAALTAMQANVRLQRCTVGRPGTPYVPFGPTPGLLAMNSLVSAVDSSFRGNDRNNQFSHAGYPGIDLVDSELQGSYLTIQGGDGFVIGAGAPGEALDADATSVVWLTDSIVLGGRATDLPGMPHHGCPVIATAGRLTRTTLDPATCAPGISTTGLGIGLRAPAPFVSGSNCTLEVNGDPFYFVGLWASLGVANVPVPGLLEQGVLLDLATALPFGVVFTDATGFASSTFSMPAGVSYATLWFQAVAEGAPPITLSPSVGGVVR